MFALLLLSSEEVGDHVDLDAGNDNEGNDLEDVPNDNAPIAGLDH